MMMLITLLKEKKFIFKEALTYTKGLWRWKQRDEARGRGSGVE